MACVDILRDPFATQVVDDPFASWVKFEDDVEYHATFNQQQTIPNKSDPFDIFTFMNEEKQNLQQKENNNIESLLDFNKMPSNISSLFVNKKKPKLCDLYNKRQNKSKSDTLSLNIVGLNTNSYLPSKLNKATLQIIKNEPFKLNKIATHLTAHSKVRDLESFIRRIYKINNNIGILMVYSHCILLNAQNALKSYGICDNSCIFIAICEDLFKYNSFILNHDNSADDFSKLFNVLSTDYLEFERLQSKIVNEIHRYQLNGFECKQITDLDILTYEMDTNCVAMPCGHGMTANALHSYVESELNANKIFIKCPHIKPDSNQKCGEIWYFPIIRYILMKSTQFKLNNLMRLELLSSLNTFKTYYHSSKCRQCKHNLYRHFCDDKDRKISHCPLCINTFCWKCGGIWLDKTSTKRCGNSNCNDLESEVLQILSQCALKRVGSVCGVPSIRLCPSCSQLINHTEGCKHMNCPRCKANFCFVCLKLMVENDWQCGSSSTICPVAPKQTNCIHQKKQIS